MRHEVDDDGVITAYGTPLAFAFLHAKNGYRVFPVRNKEEVYNRKLLPAKTPMIKNWPLEASDSLPVIGNWWNKPWMKDALVGVLVPQDMVVIDIDPRNGGSLKHAEDLLGELPKTYTVYSGRGDGGRHLYYKLPPYAPRLRGKVPGLLGAGIDFQRQGKNFVIGFGSIHPETGKPYRANSLEEAMLPDEALKVMEAKYSDEEAINWTGIEEPSAKRLEGLLAWVQFAPNGERNSRLYQSIVIAIKENWSTYTVSQLQTAGLQAGLPKEEVVKIGKSALAGLAG